MVPVARRASDQPTIAVESLRPVRPSAQATMAVPSVNPAHAAAKREAARPVAHDEVVPGLTVIAGAKTVLASDSSSCEIPFDAEIIDAADSVMCVPVIEEVEPSFEPVRALPGRRRITVGEGVLERVPQRRAWLLPTLVAVTTVVASIVVVAAS